MIDITPRQPTGVLVWSDEILDLQDDLIDQQHPVYIVGGAVRDAMLRYPLKDIDLVTTTGNGIPLARRIANTLKGDLYVMDAERDVARALIETPNGRVNIDVSGFRAGDLANDLLERDFTINAMAVDLRGDLQMLIDPLNGEKDLNQKVIRRCSPQSLYADPIRCLRAVRQSVQFSARIEPDTMRDIRANAAHLRETSAERVRDEFFKLFDLPRTATALRVADTLGLLEVVLPVITHVKADAARWSMVLTMVERIGQIFLTISPRRTDTSAAVFGLGMIVMALDRFRSQFQHHIETRFVAERSLAGLHMLAALIATAGDAKAMADEAMELLKLSSGERQRIETMLSMHNQPIFESDITPLMAHRYWRAAGVGGLDVILFMLARVLAEQAINLDQDAWILRLNRVRDLCEIYFYQHEQIVEPVMLLDGNQLQKQLQLTPGPLIGELITLIREAQVTGEIHSTDDALALARAYVNDYNNDSSSRR